MRRKLLLSLITLLAGATTLYAQLDQKDLKRGQPPPLLHKEHAAQQVYLRMMQMEDERKLDSDFLQYLTSTHAGVRRHGALTMGRIGDRSAVGPLSEMLVDDGNAKVRESAAFALGELAEPRGIKSLISSLLNNGESMEVRARAAEALGKIAALPENNRAIGTEGKDRINSLLISALPKPPTDLKPNQDILVKLSLTALMRIHSVASIDAVAAQLSSPSPEVRFTAANSLARILAANSGKATVESIATTLAALKDQSPLTRATAARALGASRNNETAEPLIALLNDNYDLIQINAIRALGLLADKRAVAPLIARGNQLLAHYRATKDPQSAELNLIFLISTALGEIKDPTALPFLKTVRTLPSGTIGSNVETEVALANFGAENFFNYESAAELKPGDWQAIANFSTGLGELGGDRAIKTLNEILEGKRAGALDARAQSEVLRALAKVKAPNFTTVLRDQLTRADDVIVRATAAELLGESKADEDFIALTNAYAKTHNDIMNDAKLAILTSVAKSGHPQAISVLTNALKDPDYLTRHQAADLLRMLNAGNFDGNIGAVKIEHDRNYYQEAANFANRSKAVIADLICAKGRVRIELFATDAPLTVENFVTLARKGYFDNLKFHRVVPNFVVQGGDPRGDGNGGPGYQIRDEVNMRPFVRGAVGMALSGKDTGGSQFFICHSPQPHLDGGYTVFGQVIEGMDVIDKIVRGDVIEKISIEE
jgi:cyclophilin family peptidyl-prolyl cis-trans isomerase/HEAT repeat protein